jgi:hypothetical protein
LNDKIRRAPNPYLSRPLQLQDPLPTLPDLPSSSDDKIYDARVAIVGAGVAGLFTGMILDYLHEKLGDKFNVSYDIFEAADKTRVGGRLFTYNFEP